MSPDTFDGAAFKAAAKRLGRIDDAIEDTAGEVVDEIAAAALYNVKRRRARHRVTGKGERFITVKATGSGAQRVSRVHAGGSIAPIIVGGSRPHTIKPLAARALSLQGAGRGFAALVRHPGTRPDPFVAKGIADTRPEVGRITDTAGDELVAELAHTIGRR